MPKDETKVTVWIRGDRELVKALKTIALQDNTNVMDIITTCLISCYSDRIPKHLHRFANYDRQNDQPEA